MSPFALIGAGTGMIVSTSSALVMELFPRKEGMMMNVHHFFYALGAIAGPLAMGAVLAKGGQWESIYRMDFMLFWGLLHEDERLRTAPRQAGFSVVILRRKTVLP
jgi:MFS family permease